ncbi:MAG: CopG family ribbon-helix-helix protein [Candidatus Thermoplasmatota archaeon]|nr:CopG family ribbon-helix-helix protein [Candidatus Thermoplasmatota archaeon]
MVIVSISLNENILNEIDRMEKELGYSGRSEVIRAGARHLISEFKDREKISGQVNAILLLIHSADSEDVVSDIKHNFEDVTVTQIHSHLRNKCLEIFILDGDAEKIKEMVRLFQTSRKMDNVKLIIA